MRLCSVKNCGHKHLAKGFCQAHYLRVYRHGTIITKNLTGSLEERLAKRSQELPNGCVVFTGTLTKKGYAHIKFKGKQKFVHVLSYEATFGPIPEELEIDHLCRNRACFNPLHLEAVPHRLNVQRGKAGINAFTNRRGADGRFEKSVRP